MCWPLSYDCGNWWIICNTISVSVVQLQEQMDEKFKKQFPNRRELEVVSSTGKWKQRDTAARVIQRAYHNYLR